MHSLGRVLHFEETHTGRVSHHERAAYAGHAHDSGTASSLQGERLSQSSTNNSAILKGPCAVTA